MDKKSKKRIDLLNKRLQKLRQQLAGAKQQMDDPDEVERIEAEMTAAQEELTRLKEA
jgi:predicted  nucleic acid-binding Zn-ribbon protein